MPLLDPSKILSAAVAVLLSVVLYPLPSTNAATACDVGKFVLVLAAEMLVSTFLDAAPPVGIVPVEMVISLFADLVTVVPPLPLIFKVVLPD